MQETYDFEALNKLLEREKQGTLISIAYGLTVTGRVFSEGNGPEKGIFGEDAPQQI